MQSEQVACGGSVAESQLAQPGQYKDRIRRELTALYTWPSLLALAVRPLRDLSAVMDINKLADVAAAINRGNQLSFAIISREYLQTGLNWICAMQRLGLKNFIIIAGDRVTCEILDERGVPNVGAIIDESEFDTSFVSSTGFSAKGLAVSAFKFPVTHFLVKTGYDVVMSDADAVWLRDPVPYLRDADVAFQRIVYHPPAIASQWGFAACGGFNAFRGGVKTTAFLERCVQENRILFDDQVVLNLALLDEDPHWHCEHPDWTLPSRQNDRSALETAFARCANAPIRGDLKTSGLQLLALPHDKFWRHAFVSTPVRDMVVCHPNSPKDDLEKMQLLDVMGLRFQSASPVFPGTEEHGRPAV
ncbi:MAG TPA: hypothetical protein DDZ81_18685 [Acetobacteraceae bacterium]|jgi:hypothetical protein|nr:hypothetical protein [Acetobacteraceae bacterium]